MALSDIFGFFDPSLPYYVSHGSLPHWEQTGATYFITFRLADSIPRSVLSCWEDQRRQWLTEHHISPTIQNWQIAFGKLPWQKQYEFFRVAAQFLEKSLDDCHGECLFARPDLANQVASALLKFDGFSIRAERAPKQNAPLPRYHISDFIVMRDGEHFERFRRYIAANPNRAKLPEGSYLLHRMEDVGNP